MIQDVKSLLDLKIEHCYGRSTRVGLLALKAVKEIRQRSHVTLEMPAAKMESLVSILVPKTDTLFARLKEEWGGLLVDFRGAIAIVTP